MDFYHWRICLLYYNSASITPCSLWVFKMFLFASDLFVYAICTSWLPGITFNMRVCACMHWKIGGRGSGTCLSSTLAYMLKFLLCSQQSTDALCSIFSVPMAQYVIAPRIKELSNPNLLYHIKIHQKLWCCNLLYQNSIKTASIQMYEIYNIHICSYALQSLNHNQKTYSFITRTVPWVSCDRLAWSASKIVASLQEGVSWETVEISYHVLWVWISIKIDGQACTFVHGG